MDKIQPLRPRPKWWTAALTSLHNVCEGSGSSPHKSIVGSKCSLYLKIILLCEMQVEYGHPSSVRSYLSGHVLHRIQCNNVSLNHIYLIVNISVISLLQ